MSRDPYIFWQDGRLSHRQLGFLLISFRSLERQHHFGRIGTRKWRKYGFLLLIYFRGHPKEPKYMQY